MTGGVTVHNLLTPMPRRQSLHHAHRLRSDRASLRGVAVVLVALLVIVAGLASFQFFRAVPSPTLRASLASQRRVAGGDPHFSWPAQGSAVVAIKGIGTLGVHNGSARYPIASVTKMMTALVVLKDHPLQIGNQGPTITVTPADVSLYQSEKAQGDSVVRVVAGEHLTEYQALEALLVPSADNFATLLADWDAGSQSAFVAKMNAEAKHLGLDHTRYAEPSGVNPGSASTVGDQLQLAELCMANAVFAHIVGKAQVTLPVAGVQYNVNSNLGTDGIIGVKTGWVPQGGASFVFAARQTSAIGHVTVMGAVFGQNSATPLATAFAEARKLVTSAPGVLRKEQVIAPHLVVGHITDSYGHEVAIETAAGASLNAWPGATYHLAFHQTRRIVAPLAAGATVGELTATLGSQSARVPVVTTRAISKPSLGWRLTRL